MLSKYEIKTQDQYKNALHEVMQQIAIAGLYRGGFFDKAAFYGGTCLRIFHSSQRFSEDLDFSLLNNEINFSLESYFKAIIIEFEALGRKVEVTKKEKTNNTKVESAFLKENTEFYDIKFTTDKTIKIKIEVDINPPPGFSTEQRLLLQPFSFMTRCYTLPDLYAGKMHALLFRKWGNRVKGRDWFDFEWYIKSSIRLNFEHFNERVKQFNGRDMSKSDFINALKERLAKTDINMVKKDVLPFTKNPKDLDIWSNDYFLKLSELLVYQ
ncbi:MAG: nucleotidyl transferase AbiEii/AbiGii toxin family protein [Bacteroidales bacterium]|nr:MAG: nucleotidyl transferase AbiEii/AbiGii toxin family protein [Bacteroidales bacterium]